MNVSPFTFETDFRTGGPGRRAADMEVGQARQQGYEQGLAQGRAEARAQMDAALAHMTGLIAEQARQLLAVQDERYARIEQAAAALAVRLARRIGGAALADRPMAQIEAAARECLAQARGATHLAVRVNGMLAEQAEELFGRLAHEGGHAGKVVILPDDDIALGDARIEWADGGMVIDHAALADAIEAAAARTLGASPDDILN